jgi:hypothetical protein
VAPFETSRPRDTRERPPCSPEHAARILEMSDSELPSSTETSNEVNRSFRTGGRSNGVQALLRPVLVFLVIPFLILMVVKYLFAI